jgi:hypothetical protein
MAQEKIVQKGISSTRSPSKFVAYQEAIDDRKMMKATLYAW